MSIESKGYSVQHERVTGHSEPAYYEMRIDGRLNQQAVAWFEEMTLSIDESQSPPQTIIRGYVRDQAVLYGLISRARDLGLTLVSVRRTQPKEEEDDSPSNNPQRRQR